MRSIKQKEKEEWSNQKKQEKIRYCKLLRRERTCQDTFHSHGRSSLICTVTPNTDMYSTMTPDGDKEQQQE